MNRDKRYLARLMLIGMLLIATRSLDLGCTYMCTPNLSHELNPLIKLTGSGWVGLMMIQIPFALLAIVLAAYYEMGPSRFLPACKPLSFSEFSSYFYCKERRSSLSLLLSRIYDGRVVWFSLGYILPRAMCLNGLILGLWAMVVWRFSGEYAELLLLLSPMVLLLAYLVPIVLFQMAFIHEQYRLYEVKDRESMRQRAA